MAERRYRWARAYRDGHLVCSRVELCIGCDTERIGLTAGESCYVTARFLERLDPELNAELRTLVVRRGAAAKRIADGLAPITLVSDLTHEMLRLVGEVRPPRMRAYQLRDVEFVIRERDSG